MSADLAAVTESLAGRMRVLLARPDRPKPGAVVMLPHVGGLTGTMRKMAARVAAEGYICVVPDLYHRLGRIVLDPESEHPDAIRVRQVAAAHVTDDSAMEDAAAAADLAEQLAQRGRIGAFGLGRSGWFALLAAARMPDRVGAAASILGFGLAGANEAKAAVALAQIRCPIYLAYAEYDQIIPPEEPATAQRLLRTAGIPWQLTVHRGTQHPYIFTDRRVHDPEAAERDWRTVTALFDRTLGAG